ncbi:MAG: nucleoside-diphosphate kinase [Candidatus Micrarchaeota archaeon]
MERTFAILKPDCVEGKHCEEVLHMLMNGGFRIISAKPVNLQEKILCEHYSHLAQKPFFPSIISYMTRSKVLLLLLERENAVSDLRGLCGPTDSNEARRIASHSIRAKFGKDKSENIIHASDSPENALAEINRFFSKKEIDSAKKAMTFEELKLLVAKLYG